LGKRSVSTAIHLAGSARIGTEKWRRSDTGASTYLIYYHFSRFGDKTRLPESGGDDDGIGNWKVFHERKSMRADFATGPGELGPGVGGAGSGAAEVRRQRRQPMFNRRRRCRYPVP
jgi:hypothetical protein